MQQKEIVIAKYKESTLMPYGCPSPFNQNVFWWEDCHVKKSIYDKSGLAASKNKNPFIHNQKYFYLENIGREAHTYLYHIINNYDDLSDQIVFTQANPHHIPCQTYMDFIKTFIWRMNNSYFDKFTPLCEILEQPCKESIDDDRDLPVNTFYKDLFGIEKEYEKKSKGSYPYYKFVRGAIFAVTKNEILSRPKEFYEKALRMCLSENYSAPTSEVEYYRGACGPWVLERLWMYIFDKNF